MTRNHRILALFILFLLPLGISLAHAAVDDIRPAKLDVAVTDKNGKPVVGLEKENFRIFEDNIEQVVTSLDTSNKPTAVVLLVQYNDVFDYYDSDVAAPAIGFLNSFQRADWIALVTFDVLPEIVTDFTRDRSALSGGLRRLQLPFYRETSVYDALYFVLESMEGVEGKKAIILLSTGLDTISKHSYSETLKKAGQSDAMIYSVSLAPFARPILDPYMEPAAQIRLLQAENVMRSFAEATGGLSFFPRFPGDYPAVYEAVSAGLKNQYTLGYFSTNQKTDGKSRKLRVEVIGTDIDLNGKPDKLNVRHKRGY